MGDNRGRGPLRRLVRAVVPDLHWATGQLSGEARATARESRAGLRERERTVLAEWEALRARLVPVVSRHVAQVGDLLADPRAEFTPGPGDEPAVVRDYLASTDAYQAAGKLLDEAEDLPDLAAVVVLADRAVDCFVAARARHLGQRPPTPRARCYYNPLHGPAVAPPRRRGQVRQNRRLAAREAAAARRPACEPCRLAIIAGQRPDVLPARFVVHDERDRPVTVLVPYYTLPRQRSIWAGTVCGSTDPDAAARVLRGEHRLGRTP